jgi:hypothetical protein
MFLSNVLHASCRYPRVKIFGKTSPADQIFPNASPNSFIQYFIYLIVGPVGDVHWSQFFTVILPVYGCVIQVYYLVNRARCSEDYFVNLKYFGGVILFCSFCKTHFFLSDTDMLSNTKFGLYCSYSPTFLFQTFPYSEYVRRCNQ